MDTVGLLLRVACSLGAVLGLVWMVRRGLLRSGGGRARAAVGSITVLARQQLTGRASVALVQVGGTGLVLGVTDSSVQVLASSPVDELLLQPAEPVGAPRPVPHRPAGRRLLPTTRRERLALPEVLLRTAPAAPQALPVDPPPAATTPVVPSGPPAQTVPGQVLDPAPSPHLGPLRTPGPEAGPGVVPGAVPDPSPAPGLEPLYEELRRRALDALPRQERREAAPSVPGAGPEATTAAAPGAFEALLGLEVGAPAPDAAATGGAVGAPSPAPAAESPAAPGARHARHARGAARGDARGGAGGGALGGSALSPATWAQAVDALRERAGRR